MAKNWIAENNFYDSMTRFVKIDGNNFGIALKQVTDVSTKSVLEWRIRNRDNKLCVIEFYKEGQGYAIYEPEIIFTDTQKFFIDRACELFEAVIQFDQSYAEFKQAYGIRKDKMRREIKQLQNKFLI